MVGHRWCPGASGWVAGREWSVGRVTGRSGSSTGCPGGLNLFNCGRSGWDLQACCGSGPRPCVWWGRDWVHPNFVHMHPCRTIARITSNCTHFAQHAQNSRTCVRTHFAHMHISRACTHSVHMHTCRTHARISRASTNPAQMQALDPNAHSVQMQTPRTC